MLFKSKDHTIYRNTCLIWAEQNSQSLAPVIADLEAMKAECWSKQQPFALQVDFFFAFPRDQLLTSHNKNQAKDADNLIKAALDSLVKVLKIDDRHFYRASCEKILDTSEEPKACTTIRINPMTPRTTEALRQQIRMERGQTQASSS